MTRKRSDKEIVVSPSVAQAPSRRKAVRARAKYAATPAETPTSALSVPNPDAAVSHEVAVITVAEPSRKEIAALAFLYWEARGCRGGSPEEDWLRAERELTMRA